MRSAGKIYEVEEEGKIYKFTQREIDEEVKDIIIKYENEKRHISDLCKLLNRKEREINSYLKRKYKWRSLKYKGVSEREII